MRKSKVKKMKLASLLLLSTVLIPNIAYAEEEIDESMEAETYTVSEEVQNTEETDQTINEQDTETEENAETSVTTESEAGTQEAIPDVNTYNNDIETESGNVEEESADGGGGDILQPAEPDQQPEEEPVEIPEEPELNEETAEPEREEETLTDESDNNEADFETLSPENGEDSAEQEILEEEPEIPVLPVEPVKPEPSAEPDEEAVPDQDAENYAAEQPAEGTPEYIQDTLPETFEPSTEETETAGQDPSTLGTEPKKLYHYDFGDILNGISFSKESFHADLSTLDQRVARVMSSKIIEEKDLTASQKIELEEKVKAEQTNSYERDELPNTGEAGSANYAVAVLLTIFGAILIFISRKLKTDN